MKITSVNAQQITANIPKNRDISKLENIGDANAPSFQERLATGLQDVLKHKIVLPSLPKILNWAPRMIWQKLW